MRRRRPGGGGEAALPPRAGISAGAFFWSAGGASLQIQRRATGATQIGCGKSNSAQLRRPRPPYVIGPNGLALIRGPNRLADLLRKVRKEFRTAAKRRTNGVPLDLACDRPRGEIRRRALHERQHPAKRHRQRDDLDLVKWRSRRRPGGENALAGAEREARIVAGLPENSGCLQPRSPRPRDCSQRAGPRGASRTLTCIVR
jgi:hypothetical protein